MRRSTSVLVVLLIFFFGFKVLRFQTLAYTFHDMYGFLQIATSWIDGRPLMYENYFGYHQRIHNYYTLLLWGPIAYQFGAYGLFLVQVSLLLFAFVLANQRVYKAGTHNWARYGLLAVVLLGPTSIWLNDHTTMGWHTELTYFPLGILFGLSLMEKNWIWPVIGGLGVTLVKEDGAVLAATIHLTYFSINYLQRYSNRSPWYILIERRFWFISLGWGVVFMAGMIWLSHSNSAGEPRLQLALSSLAENIDTSTFWLRIGKEVGTSLLLLLVPICYLILISQQLEKPIRGRLLALYGIGITILSIMNLVQSFYYYDDPFPSAFHIFGLTWPPRFVLLWAFTAVFLITVLIIMPSNKRLVQPVFIWMIIGGFIVIQLPILRLIRFDLPGVTEMRALIRGEISPFKERYYLDPNDLAKIHCVADQIPARSNVMAFDYVSPYFHKHYLVWETGHHFKPADLAIVPINTEESQRKKWDKDINISMRKPYRIIRLNSYLLYVTKDFEPTIQSCVQ